MTAPLLIKDSDGVALTGRLPLGWADVPLAAYAALAAAARPVPAGLNATAHAWANPAGCRALAALLQLPTAEPLLADASLLLPIYHAVPWLFRGPLPAATEPVPAFTHEGVRYVWGGGLDKATAGQMEALLSFVQDHEGNPLGCAPHLLAVLYRPEGQTEQTADTVVAAAEALATLPMSIAWPALRDFTLCSAPWVAATQRYSAARAGAEEALSTLEQALTSPPSGQRGSYWSMGRWLGRVWIRHVRKLLTMYSPRFATTVSSKALPKRARVDSAP